MGPKFQARHELPKEAATRAQCIATDSLAQVQGYAHPFFLTDTPALEQLVELGSIIAKEQPGRTAPEDITLFCSVGLAGTEVLVASQLFK